MRIRLTDETLLADLLRFMRASGCIAYYQAEPESIEVLRPRAFGEKEFSEITVLLDRWSAEHPEAEPEVLG
ncbi:MAG TPA: hypothetical protein VF963_07560 [Gaiellaceae bacterium]